MHQSAALAAPVSAQTAQTAQKRANPQNVSQERLCLSVNSHETPASEPSWAGASATACSESLGSSDSASDWPTPQSERTCSPAWMQNMGQNSQLEEPTAAVLEDAVVAWHAELQLLPCEHHHHYHLAPVLQHSYHLQGRESKASREKHCHS